MTTLFNVWNPARIGDEEVSFDVTRANVPGVSSGDPDWVAACLEAIGVSAPARDWSIQASRCHFYSDYYDEPVWEDRWPETWVVRVRLDGKAPQTFGPPEWVPRNVDRYDRTWENDEVDADHDRTALLLLLLRGQQAEADSVRDHLQAELPAVCSVRSTRVEAAGPDWFRIRILVRDGLFPDLVKELDAVIREGRRQGLVVNRNELIGRDDLV